MFTLLKGWKFKSSYKFMGYYMSRIIICLREWGNREKHSSLYASYKYGKILNIKSHMFYKQRPCKELIHKEN